MAPRRGPPPARPGVRTAPSPEAPRKTSTVLLLHEAIAAAYAPAARAVSPGIEVLVLPESGVLPPGSDRTRIYHRWWEGGEEHALSLLLEAAPALDWVHTPSAGVDQLPLDQLARRGIALTNARGIHSVPLAESAMAFLLARAKKCREHLNNQRRKRFEVLRLDELLGRDLLLYGYGSVGREIAARARGFGMRIAAVRRTGGREKDLSRVFGPGELVAAVASADAVVIAAPLTERTRGAFDREVFAAMKEGCHLINLSRGEITVERDLVAGLRKGRPAFASLDVFEEEPLAPSSPLWELDNVAVTPHDSWRSPHTRARNLGLFLDNLRRYLSGRPLANLVDFRKGY